jgi:hypothetical protein
MTLYRYSGIPQGRVVRLEKDGDGAGCGVGDGVRPVAGWGGAGARSARLLGAVAAEASRGEEAPEFRPAPF